MMDAIVSDGAKCEREKEIESYDDVWKIIRSRSIL